MPKLIGLRLKCLVVWLVPVTFLLLKLCQIKAEHRLAASPQTGWLVELLERRLDDPSWWAATASAIAALLVIHGIQLLGRGFQDNGAKWYRMKRRWALLVAVTITFIYLATTLLKREGFFFALGESSASKDPAILCIQAIEGLSNVLLIWIMAQFFGVALAAIDYARGGSEQSVHHNVCSARSCFASAGAFPISAFLTFQIITWATGREPSFTQPWPIWSGLAAISPLAVPFGIVAFNAIFALRKTCSPCLNSLAVLHVIVWWTLVALGIGTYRPPRWLVAVDGIWGVSFGILGFLVLPAPIAFWVDFNCKGRDTPP